MNSCFMFRNVASSFFFFFFFKGLCVRVCTTPFHMKSLSLFTRLNLVLAQGQKYGSPSENQTH